MAKGKQADEPLVPNLGVKVAFSLPGIPGLVGVVLEIKYPRYERGETIAYDLLASHAGWVVRAIAAHLIINPEQRDDSEPSYLADEIATASLSLPSTLKGQEKEWWGVVNDAW